jgi:hypothetical protein
LAFIFKTVSAVSVAVFSADVRASVTFSSMKADPKRASHADKEGHVALADWRREAPLVERSGEGSINRPWMILQRVQKWRISECKAIFHIPLKTDQQDSTSKRISYAFFPFSQKIGRIWKHRNNESTRVWRNIKAKSARYGG